MKKKLLGLLVGLGIVALPFVAEAVILGGNGGGTGYGTTTAGNVGNCLSVASTSPFLTYSFGSCGGSSSTLIYQGNGILVNTSGTSGYIINLATGTAGYFPFYNASGNALTPTSSIFQSGTNIGIGTSTPQTSLSVVGSTTISTDLTANTGHFNNIYDNGATTTYCLGDSTGLIGSTPCVNSINGLSGVVIATGTTNQIQVATGTGNLVFSFPVVPLPASVGGTATTTALGLCAFLNTCGSGGFTNANASTGIAITTSSALISIQNAGVTALTSAAPLTANTSATGTVTINFTNPGYVTYASSGSWTGVNTFNTSTVFNATATFNSSTVFTAAISSTAISFTTATSTGAVNFGGNLNVTGTISESGVQVSTTTVGNPSASIGSSTVNGTAQTFMRSDGAPALAPQYASSSVTVNYYDATTTAPYRYFQAICPNKTITLGQITYAEYAAATDTVEWVRTTNQATSTVDTLIDASTSATPVTSSTVTFSSSTINPATCLEGIVTSTVGVPSWSVFTIYYITD